MKRSEMVKLIAEKLYIYTEQGVRLASETLEWLEAQGMCPPPRSLNEGEYKVMIYEWEPEVTETELDVTKKGDK